MLVTQCVQVILHKLTHSHHITAAIFSHAHAWLASAHAPTAHRTGPAWACRRAAARPASVQQLHAWTLYCKRWNWLKTLCAHCFRVILFIVTCFFTIMLVEFLNIKHSHSHCEWYTLIKRQCCDWFLSVASWTFALISYETVTVRDTQCSVSSADQTWSSAILRPAPATPLCGPTSRRRCRRSGWRTQS